MEKCEKLDYNSSSGAPEKVSFEFKEGYLDIVRVSSVPNLKMKDLCTCKGAKGDDEHLVDLLAPLSVVGGLSECLQLVERVRWWKRSYLRPESRLNEECPGRLRSLRESHGGQPACRSPRSRRHRLGTRSLRYGGSATKTDA